MINLQDNITLKHNVDITITYFEDLYKVDKPQLVTTSYQEFIRVLSQPKTFTSKASAGGFVGGPVIDRRENANVQNRTLLTFDLDDCPPHFDLYQHMLDHFGVAFVMYSSHRHTVQAPNKAYRYKVFCCQIRFKKWSQSGTQSDTLNLRRE